MEKAECAELISCIKIVTFFSLFGIGLPFIIFSFFNLSWQDMSNARVIELIWVSAALLSGIFRKFF